MASLIILKEWSKTEVHWGNIRVYMYTLGITHTTYISHNRICSSSPFLQTLIVKINTSDAFHYSLAIHIVNIEVVAKLPTFMRDGICIFTLSSGDTNIIHLA